MSGNDVIISHADYLRTVRRWWWLILIMPLVFGGLTYELLSQRELTYTATTTLLISQGSLLEANSGDDIENANALTQVYSALVTSPAVLERVDQELDLSLSALELADYVGAEADPQIPVLTIWAETTDPAIAAMIANSTASALIDWLSERDLETSGESRRTLQQRIDEVWANIQATSAEVANLRNEGTPGPDTDAAINGLESLLQQYWATYESLLELQQRLGLETLSSQNRLTVIAPAQEPDSANQQSPLLFSAVAALFGLGVAAMGVAAVDLLNRRIRSPQDVQRAVQLPVLATVPRFRRLPVPRRHVLPTVVAPDSPTADAYRSLRTRCQLSVNGHGLGTIALTSAGPNESVADVAANLAVSFAEAGLKVILVEGDIRSPSYHRFVRQPETAPGLATLLAFPTLQPEKVLVPGPHPRLRVLLAGSQEANRSRIVDSARLEEILTELRKKADVVVIHAPSALSVSDGLVVAAAADSTLLVAYAGKTRPGALQSAAESLTSVRLSVLGVVLNGVDRKHGVV